MKSLKQFPTLLLLAILFTHALSQESRPALLRSLSPGVVSIEGRSIDPGTGRGARTEIVGSGFFVNEQARAITRYQVIAGLKKIAARTKSGRRPKARQTEKRMTSYRGKAAKTLSDSESYYNLGRVHDALNHYSEAESAYRKSLSLKTSADACRALGILFLTRKDGRSKNAQRREYIEKAIEYLNCAIAISPDDGKARYNLAVAYFEINEKDRARPQCGALSKLRGRRKLTQPVLGNAARLCSWSNSPYKF